MDTKEECNNDKNDKNDKKSVFTPPTPEQVHEYFLEIGVNGQEFEKFHDHYTGRRLSSLSSGSFRLVKSNR